MIYGVGVNVKTGEIFPATFPDKGPDQALRCARYLTGVSQVSKYTNYLEIWKKLCHKIFQNILIKFIPNKADLFYLLQSI